MNEKLLQFIWLFQYFNSSELKTVEEEPLLILAPGRLNRNQGPDFSMARIQLGCTTWSGNIEVHVFASEWYRHHHQNDENYTNVILHVVWKYDLTESSSLPGISTLELQPRIAHMLLHRYEQLMNSPCLVPCEKSLPAVKEIVWTNWKECLLLERLARKAQYVTTLLEQSKFHWGETFWWMIARSFGALVNADAFEIIARSIPITVLTRHKHQIHQLEALLFGQAGMLNCSMTEPYGLLLQKEYGFYKKKYRLKQVPVSLKSLRMRPSSFPAVRLAQLAMLIHTSSHLLSSVIEGKTVREVKALLTVTANDYWHYHYHFGEAGELSIKKTGDDMVSNIVINTIVPVLFAYGSYHKNELYTSKAVSWLEEITAEKNRIMRGWSASGVVSKNAFDSQALLELKINYCDYKRCLECKVGNALLRMPEP